MGQVVYYAATSLDGKIAAADKENPVKWLDKFNETLDGFEDGVNTQEALDIVIELENSIRDIDEMDYCLPIQV